jgi:DNA-binding MarR family transcriptional regulator
MVKTESLALWARFMRVSRDVLADVEVQLKSTGFPPLAWYDLLLELHNAAPDGLRPLELQRQMLLAQYNLSRMVDRMVQAGLVRRGECPEDRRGYVLYLTEKGRTLRYAMWPAYRDAVRDRFYGRLSEAYAGSLVGIMYGFL